MLTMKAYKQFGLFQDPFTGDVTKADDVYLTDETRFVAEFLYQTAKAGGMVALLGESGSGKTTILASDPACGGKSRETTFERFSEQLCCEGL